MGKFRLTTAAEEDLISIATFGDAQFGIDQSDKYREQLKRRFSLLAEQPLLYTAVDYIRVGYRRSVCGVHSIYYRIEAGEVEIIRILKNQDLNQEL